MIPPQERKKLLSLLAEHRHAQRIVREERSALKDVRQQIASVQTAQQLVQEIAEEVQNKAHKQIASVVSRCLEAVFGEDAYEFEIRFSRKRGKTEAQLVFVRDGQVREDPLREVGLGVLDVASVALRLSCLMLSLPRKRRLVCLDEPYKHLSKQYRPAIRDLLLVLAKEMGFQFILSTHSMEIAAGTVVEL